MRKASGKSGKDEREERAPETSGGRQEGTGASREQEAGEVESPADSRGGETEVGRGGEETSPSEEAEAGTEGTGEEKASSEAEVADLKGKLEAAVAEKAGLQDRVVRLMADFDNFRKRVKREKSDLIQFGNEALLRDFLPIVDNIERILTYSFQEGNWKSFQEGIELVLAEIHKTFSKYGVEPIEALGKPFDPNLHEAMQRCETDEAAPNTVVEVLQKGYLYRGRLLRPALVVVAVQPESAPEASAPEGDDGGPGDPKEGAPGGSSES